MAELSQDGDRVVLDLGEARSDAVFSIDIAEWFAAGLEEYAGKAAVSLTQGNRDREPTVYVDAVVSSDKWGQKPMVRLRFGWRAARFWLTPQHAVGLAAWLRMAARKAESMLTWTEDSCPTELLI